MLDRLRTTFSLCPIKIRRLISLWKAIEAAEVAAVGYRNPKIAKRAPKRIPQTTRRTHGLLLGAAGLGEDDGDVGFCSGALSKDPGFVSDAGRSTFGVAGGVATFSLSLEEGGEADLDSGASLLVSGFSTEDFVFLYAW